MMLRLLAGALVVATIFVMSPERQRVPAAIPAAALPGAEALAAIPGGEAAREAFAGRVARSLLTDGIARTRQALPVAEPVKLEAKPARGSPRS